MKQTDKLHNTNGPRPQPLPTPLSLTAQKMQIWCYDVE